MLFKVKDKEYNVKFGYEVTAKSKIMSLVAKESTEEVNLEDDKALPVAMMDAVGETMILVAKMLLVGLQRFHSDEFGYDYNIGDDLEKAESIHKVYDLLEEYFDEEDADFGKLYSELENELVANGFLSKMFKEELMKAKAELENQVKKTKTTRAKSK